MMKKIMAAAIIFLAAGTASAQEWTLSTVLGDMSIEALAVAPNGTVWAGQSNSIYRFDLTSWTLVTTVTGWSGIEFFGAVAPANDRAYFSGWGEPPGGGSRAGCPPSIYLPIVLRKTGEAGKSLSWWDVGFKEAPWECSAHLWAAANGMGGYDVWAASGDSLYKSSNDGESWVSFTAPGVAYFSDIDGSGTSDIWAAGADSVDYNPCLYRYNGSAWTIFTSASMASSPVVCLPEPQIPWYAAGMAGGFDIGRFDGGWENLTGFANNWPNCMTSNLQTGGVWVGTRNYGETPATGCIFHSSDGLSWSVHTFAAPVYSADASYPGVVWAATTGVVYYQGQPPSPGRRKPWQTDFNGDGTSDIAVFRPTSGLWAVRGLTRLYFGGSADRPVPGDYTGDGTAGVGIFRNTSGLWAVRGLTRVYFGGSSDLSVPGDYDGDGTNDVGIFRNASGLWAVRGFTRAYFGGSADRPYPGDYTGSGTTDIGVFRGTTGLWAIKGVTRIYFGVSSDRPVPGDYAGSGTSDIGIFRGTTGLWAIKGLTRLYFGASSDTPVPGDYSGDGTLAPTVFRPNTGLWAIRGLTRLYFGGSSDTPVSR